MDTAKVIKNIESAINRVCNDIKQKKGGSGADKLESLSKLINAYSRLVERSKETDSLNGLIGCGKPNRVEKIDDPPPDRRGIIR